MLQNFIQLGKKEEEERNTLHINLASRPIETSEVAHMLMLLPLFEPNFLLYDPHSGVIRAR